MSEEKRNIQAEFFKSCQGKTVGEALNDTQILTAYLTFFYKKPDVESLAAKMIADTGNIYNLIHIPTHHLQNIYHLSEPIAAAVANLGVVYDRIRKHTVKKQVLDTIPDLYRHCRPYFNGIYYEKLLIVCLNKRMQYIATEEHTLFHPTQVSGQASLILEVANKYHASILFLAHNHPRTKVSTLHPSPADKEVTDYLAAILEKEKVYLLDHILFSYDGCVSMRNSNLKPYYDPEYHPDHPHEIYPMYMPPRFPK